MTAGSGGLSNGFPLGLSPAPMATTIPQAPLRSRTVGFTQSGSDLGFPLRALPTCGETYVLAHLHPAAASLPTNSSLLRGSVDSRLCVRKPPWDRQVPRAPLPHVGVTAIGEASRASSESLTPPSSLLRAHAPDLYPPAAFGVPLATGLCRLLPAPAGPRPFPTLSL